MATNNEDTERVTVRLTVRMAKQLRKVAQAEERPVNTVVARALRAYFDAHAAAHPNDTTERNR